MRLPCSFNSINSTKQIEEKENRYKNILRNNLAKPYNDLVKKFYTY